jgi:hypothetical protein
MLKAALSLLVAFLNAAMTLFGIYTAFPAPSLGVLVGRTAIFILPFGTAAIYALRGKPTWLWNASLLANLALTALAWWMSLYDGAMGMGAALLPIINMAYLLYCVPHRKSPAPAVRVDEGTP